MPRSHRHTLACLPQTSPWHASALPAHFNEAQAGQVLWQAFRDHGASLNNALNVALRIHAGPAWQIFKVRMFFRFWSPPLVFSAFVLLLTQFISCLVRR
jgi:hypothetical protein